MRKLVFDIDITGHHTEYIEYLIRYLVTKRDNKDHYCFVLNPHFHKEFGHISQLAQQSDCIEIHTVTPDEFRGAKKGSLPSQSINHYKLLKFYALKTKADLAIILHINIFQLALIFYRPNFNIKGILFSQFTRQDLSKNLNEKLRYARRFLQTWGFIMNSKVDSVFLLNDNESCNKLNATFGTSKFRYLPDPVPEIIVDEFIDIRKQFEISPERSIFLHFGSLSERKGTFEVLEALKYVNPETAARLAIIIAGKVDSEQTKEAIFKLIREINQENIQAQVIFKEGFSTNNLKNNLFAQCDMVLIPYKNVEASSGILAHAISAGKPVLGGASGLLGKLISENELGVVIDSVTPQNLAKVYEKDLVFTLSSDDGSYKLSHSPNDFAAAVLENESDKHTMQI